MKVFLAALGLVAIGGCSGGIDCAAKACPNDPDPDQGTVTHCDKVQSSCQQLCATYLACVDSNKSKTCGADGKTDPNLVSMVKASCNPTMPCTTCILSIP